MFEIFALFLLLFVSSIQCNMTSLCNLNQKSMSSLDKAIDMIREAKSNIPICRGCDGSLQTRAVDCDDLFRMGYTESGVYKIQPMHRLLESKFINVYCDMQTDDGGWTVIQRRGDFQNPVDYFFKDWKDYKEGFGHLQKEFWLGNDNIFLLTNQKLYSARFDLKDIKHEKRYALYDKFWIDDENQKYTLHISDYMGDAGDSMAFHDNQKFSTKDQDNDLSVGSCAETFKGAWWYKSCHQSNLNALYLKGKLNDTFTDKGLIWNTWKAKNESLEWTEIKIRPKNYRRTVQTSVTDSTIKPM